MPRNRRKKSAINKIKILGIILKCCIPIVLLFCAYAGFQKFKTSRAMMVKQIIVRGNEHASRNELLAFLNLKPGDGMLTLPLEKLATTLQTHPWVAKANIQRVLPDTVIVTVQEHRPVLQYQDTLIDADGLLFPKTDAHDDVQVATFKGSKKIIPQALELQQYLKQTSLGHLKEIQYDEALGFSIIIAYDEKQNVRIHLGFQPSSRVPIAHATLQRLRELGRVPDIIWADGIKNPKRVHVKLAGDNLWHSETN